MKRIAFKKELIYSNLELIFFAIATNVNVHKIGIETIGDFVELAK